MKIALDYDNTYSLDSAFWLAIADYAIYCGHEVRIVTIRDERYDRTEPLIKVEKTFDVIYTRGVAKRWYCEHFGDGFVPDVWIDDTPESILYNSPATPEALAEWRQNRDEAVDSVS